MSESRKLDLSQPPVSPVMQGYPAEPAVTNGLSILPKEVRMLITAQLRHNDLLNLRKTSAAVKGNIDQETMIATLKRPYSYAEMFSFFQQGSLEKLQDEIIATEEGQEAYQQALEPYIDAENTYQRKSRNHEIAKNCSYCGNGIAICGCIPSAITWCVLVGKDSASAGAIAAAGYSTLGFMACYVPTALLFCAFEGVILGDCCIPTKPIRPREADYSPNLDEISNADLKDATFLRSLAHEQRGNKLGR